MGSSCDKDDNTSSQFGGFPTPVSLQVAQLQYSKKHKNNNNNNKTKPQNNKDGVPDPFPPPTLKSEIYNVADFKDIDAHAQSTPLTYAADSYNALASYLCRPAKYDIGKIRSFYVWIASQRLRKVVDFVGTKIPPEDTPLYTVLLILVKGWGNGYSELFTKLCQQLNIPCRTVKGKVKGAGYIVGQNVTPTNDYCIVFINGAWRFVDPHWGSQYVITAVDNNDDWEMMTDGSANNGDADGLEVNRVCDDFYFLTDPVAMVYTHLTLDPPSQLLARTITEEEFNQMAYLKDSFFEYGMSTINQPKCVVMADDKGRAVFEFGIDKSRACSFTSSLYKSANDPSLNIVDGGCTYDQYVTLERVPGKLRATLCFPRVGHYKFELHGKETGNPEGLTAICEYVVECKKPDFTAEPNPDNTGGEWGPAAGMMTYGLEPVGQESGIIHAKDGKATLQLHMLNESKLRFKRKLTSIESPTEELNDYVCYYKTQQEAVFLMKFPHQGKYILEIFAKPGDTKLAKQNNGTTANEMTSLQGPGGKKISYEKICSYLIKSDRGCHDLAPYPQLNNKHGQTGNQLDLVGTDLVLAPVSHPQAVIDPNNDGDLTITMLSNQEVDDLYVQMSRFYHPEGEEEDCSNYATIQRNKFAISLQLIFYKFGFYRVNVMRQDTVVYQYLVSVYQPNTKSFPFPIPGPAWKTQFEVVQPKSSLLEAKKKETFKLRVPGVQKVRVESEATGQKTELTSKKNDMWEGTVMTDAQQTNLNVVCDLINGGGTDTLLTYMVLDSEMMTSFHDSQQANNKEAEERRHDMEERKNSEKEEAERLQREKEQRAHDAEDYFDKNRTAIEREEAEVKEKQDEEDRQEVAALAENSKEHTMKIQTSDLQNIDDDDKEDWKVTGHEREDDHHRPVKVEDVTPRTQRTEMDDDDLFEETPRRQEMKDCTDKNDWHYYHSKLSQQMALEKLRESMRRRDHTMLKNAIVDCQSFDKLHNNNEVVTANKTLHVIEARRDLQKACDAKDCDEIRRQLGNIRKAGLSGYLQAETREAFYLLETLDRSHPNKTKLDVSRKVMTEIRRYQNPPPVMHRVMQAALLLLGEDEDTTESWKQCQKLCNPQGHQGLNRKLYGFKASNVHPEIIARSKEILSEYDLAKMQSVSNGAVTFYVWTKGVIEEAEDNESHKPESEQNAKPASRERQKELLGRLPPTEPKKTRQYWKGIVSAQDSSKQQVPANNGYDNEFDDEEYDY